MRPTYIKELLLLSTITLAASALSSCETTGDPTKGGIFWSPAKAQQRLDQRQQTLSDINDDTSRVQNSNQQKEQQLNQGQ
jgi:hypothetical protein